MSRWRSSSRRAWASSLRARATSPRASPTWPRASESSRRASVSSRSSAFARRSPSPRTAWRSRIADSSASADASTAAGARIGIAAGGRAGAARACANSAAISRARVASNAAAGARASTAAGATRSAARWRRWRPLGQATLGHRPPRHRGSGQVLGLVDRPAHPPQLPLEVGDVVMQRPKVARRGARLLGQRLLDLGAPRSLGVDVLLGASELSLALGDHVPQAVGLLARAPQIVLDLPDAVVEGDQRRLGFGRAPARALGRELGAAQLPGLEQLRPGTLGGTGGTGGAGFLDRPRHLPHRQRHHHRPQLQERLARQLRGKLRRNRECHPPGTRRGARQRRRLGHRHEPLPDRAGLDHEHRLAAELGAPAAPAPGDANGDAAPSFGH